MEPVASAFATIVSLTVAFIQERRSSKAASIEEFEQYLTEQNHQDLLKQIESCRTTGVYVKAILNQQIPLIFKELSKINESLNQIDPMYYFGELKDLATNNKDLLLKAVEKIEQKLQKNPLINQHTVGDRSPAIAAGHSSTVNASIDNSIQTTTNNNVDQSKIQTINGPKIRIGQLIVQDQSTVPPTEPPKSNLADKDKNLKKTIDVFSELDKKIGEVYEQMYDSFTGPLNYLYESLVVQGKKWLGDFGSEGELCLELITLCASPYNQADKPDGLEEALEAIKTCFNQNERSKSKLVSTYPEFTQLLALLLKVNAYANKKENIHKKVSVNEEDNIETSVILDEVPLKNYKTLLDISLFIIAQGKANLVVSFDPKPPAKTKLIDDYWRDPNAILLDSNESALPIGPDEDAQLEEYIRSLLVIMGKDDEESIRFARVVPQLVGEFNRIAVRDPKTKEELLKDLEFLLNDDKKQKYSQKYIYYREGDHQLAGLIEQLTKLDQSLIPIVSWREGGTSFVISPNVATHLIDLSNLIAHQVTKQ